MSAVEKAVGDRRVRGTRRDSIVIAAALAHRYGYGGHAWALLQYALGFRALGFDVTLIDRLEPAMLLSSQEEPAAASAAALHYMRELMTSHRLEGRYCVLGAEGSSLLGLSREEALARVTRARALVNVMGFLIDPELLEAARRRVFLDIDPGFGQLWRELGLADLFQGHDAFVTVGRNVGRPGCEVPTCGIRWTTIPHPVVLNGAPTLGRGTGFTSVGSWRGPYDSIERQDESFGLRAHQFRRFAGLPRLVQAPFRLALDIDEADHADLVRLREGGWKLLDPRKVAYRPSSYVRFIRSSLAEFTVAKDIYVKLRSGWLGDRTVCYLANGKPALVQDTGLATHYDLGEGLIAFSTLEEAVAGAEEIARAPAIHSRAARRLAETQFDARVVLNRLLEEVS